MAFDVRKLEYYETTIEGDAGEGHKLLTLVAAAGVSLRAFKAIPQGPARTRFSLFPDNGTKMTEGAKKAGVKLDGPYSALLVEGGDVAGTCAKIHEKISRAGINVKESSGIADINGGYGVVVYLNENDCEKAAAALRS